MPSSADQNNKNNKNEGEPILSSIDESLLDLMGQIEGKKNKNASDNHKNDELRTLMPEEDHNSDIGSPQSPLNDEDSITKKQQSDNENVKGRTMHPRMGML